MIKSSLDDDNIELSRSASLKQVGDPYYILVIKSESQLRNGFRYIKELLTQIHNHEFFNAYNLLKSNQINTRSIKTDCFTIKASDLERVKQLLNFDGAIGNWRVSKTEDIIKPCENQKMKPCIYFQYNKPVANLLKMNDECDTSELCSLFENTRASR